MATIKKYNGSTWENAVVRKYGTASEIITPPTTIYTDGTTISTYTIKGNTVQSGTPTPSSPISVNGVGNKTANLLDMSQSVYGEGLTSGIGATTPTFAPSASTSHSGMIKVKSSTEYTIKLSEAPTTARSIYMYDSSQVFTRVYPTQQSTISLTITTGANEEYIIFGYNINDTHAMLVEGETAPSEFIPFGYKIPISTLQGSAVNYLGSVQSERKVQKYVFTGTEDSNALRMNTAGFFIFTISSLIRDNKGCALSTHYQTAQVINADMPDKSIKQTTTTATQTGCAVIIKDTQYTTLEDFKTFLATQYAAGTPVTVWYCLVDAQVAIVNEPLMKLVGTDNVVYADSISNAVAIPTTEGANSITVDTTVQPSEFTATWTGWHNASVQEYVGGVGNNKFDEQYPDISDTIIYKPIYVGDGNFTLSTTAPQTSDPAALLFLLSGNVSSGASSSANGVWSGQNRTKAAVDGYVTVAYRAIRDYTPVGSQTMLNAGSTALTYEPYEYGWE